MLKQPMIEKLAGHASPRHGRGTENAGAGSGCARAELPGALGAAGGSTVELAGESGARAAAEECQAPHERLRRRDRLSHRARPG